MALNVSKKCTIGPKIIGGFIIVRVKLGFSSLIKFHAAFSATFLLPR